MAVNVSPAGRFFEKKLRKKPQTFYIFELGFFIVNVGCVAPFYAPFLPSIQAENPFQTWQDSGVLILNGRQRKENYKTISIRKEPEGTL